jgi:hypothetical protein
LHFLPNGLAIYDWICFCIVFVFKNSVIFGWNFDMSGKILIFSGKSMISPENFLVSPENFLVPLENFCHFLEKMWYVRKNFWYVRKFFLRWHPPPPPPLPVANISGKKFLGALFNRKVPLEACPPNF